MSGILRASRSPTPSATAPPPVNAIPATPHVGRPQRETRSPGHLAASGFAIIPPGASITSRVDTSIVDAHDAAKAAQVSANANGHTKLPKKTSAVKGPSKDSESSPPLNGDNLRAPPSSLL
jgi:hypothetical protein